MPLRDMEPAAHDAAMRAVESGLLVIFDDLGIERDIQVGIFETFSNVRRYARLATTEAELRTRITRFPGLDPDATALQSRQMADLIAAWEIACKQQDKEVEAMVDKKTAPGPSLPTGKVEQRQLRVQVEAVIGRMQPKQVPSRYMVGSKLEQLEENEPEAEPLEEVHWNEAGEDFMPLLVVSGAGQVQVRKGVAKRVPKPKDGEELRARYQLIATAWMFARVKHPNRPWLAGMSPRDYSSLADDMLGEQVAKLEVKESSGELVRPQWDQVLTYDFEVRTKAYELVIYDGITLTAALVAARKDSEIRNLHLITPLAVGGGKVQHTDSQQSQLAVWQPPWLRPQQQATQSKGAKGGKGGGGSKGGKGDGGTRKNKQQRSGKGGRSDLKSKTQDGRAICFKYNNQEGDCSGSCGFVHICQRCEGDHPAYSSSCPRRR
jgi:hypothetical protein